MKGKFITFEGPEGSGKSTNMLILNTYLLEKGIETSCTKEPGGTALGKFIRKILQHNEAGEPPIPRAELLLFLADRAQHVETFILPSLQRGHWVLCDRFEDSTFAYQGFGRGFGLESLRTVNAFATAGLKPDLTLLLDVPVDVSMARIAARNTGLDRIEKEAREFHTRLREGYLALAEQSPNQYVYIDANRSLQAIWPDIKTAIDKLLDAE